jgi:hypothetical protein
VVVLSTTLVVLAVARLAKVPQLLLYPVLVLQLLFFRLAARAMLTAQAVTAHLQALQA